MQHPRHHGTQVNEVVGGMEKMLGRLIDENVELIFALGPQVGRLKADSGYVGQVLMNLVVNARDAMPNGGKITVETANATLDQDFARAHPGAAPGDYVMLRVSDTGTGMTDEVKAHLFEAFFTTKPKGKGTGLGLATCQTIVQQCGGHIAVSSEPGKGATFRVYFPRVAGSDHAPDASFNKTGPHAARDGNVTCWWKTSRGCAIWRRMFCGRKATRCCRPPTARMDCMWRATTRGRRSVWSSPM
jgi:K+-sensing histidine kinase KdpD